MTWWLSRGSAKTNACLLHVVASQRTRIAINPFQAVQRPTWIPRYFALLFLIPFARNLHNLELLALTLEVHKKARSKGGISNSHKTQRSQQIRTHKTQTWAQETSTLERSSNHWNVEQVCRNGVWVIKSAQRMLGVLLHAPRGPFYSPKAARSRWEQSGKAILAFCRLAHRTVRCTPDSPVHTGQCPVSDFFPSTLKPTVGGQRAVGAPDTVRCTPDSPVPHSGRWLGHVSRADRAADHWLTGQSDEL
jgi:hypothetical protein